MTRREKYHTLTLRQGHRTVDRLIDEAEVSALVDGLMVHVRYQGQSFAIPRPHLERALADLDASQ